MRTNEFRLTAASAFCYLKIAEFMGAYRRKLVRDRYRALCPVWIVHIFSRVRTITGDLEN